MSEWDKNAPMSSRQLRRAFAADSRKSKGGGHRGTSAHVILHGKEHKSCSKCISLKPISEFGPDSSNADGLHSSCRSCGR